MLTPEQAQAKIDRAFSALRKAQKLKRQAKSARDRRVVRDMVEQPRDGRTVILPLLTISEMNASDREHWGSRHKRVKAQRLCAKNLVITYLGHPNLPLTVRLTRIGPRELDSDNVQSALKAVRDGIAAAWGVDDGPSGPIAWEYAQERGEYAVRVEVQS